jgi:hypothetical protein
LIDAAVDDLVLEVGHKYEQHEALNLGNGYAVMKCTAGKRLLNGYQMLFCRQRTPHDSYA